MESLVPTLEIQAAQSAPPPPIPPVPANPGAATATQQAIESAIESAIQDAQNAVAQGGTTAPPPVYMREPDIPPEVVPIIGIVFGSIALMVIVTPIVRGIMKFIERKQDQGLVHGPSVMNQLQQLQQSVDTLAIEMERISESQRFQAKLLAERDKGSLPSGKGGA